MAFAVIQSKISNRIRAKLTAFVRCIGGNSGCIGRIDLGATAGSVDTAKMVAERDAAAILGTYARFERVIVRGEGVKVWDDQGNEYLDLAAGIAVNSLGHCHPAVVRAVDKQMRQLMHTSNLYRSLPSIELAERLVALSHFDKVFICNSGTEANEAAIKFARRYAQTKGIPRGPPKQKIIAFKGGFHGRTAGSLSVTHKPSIREPFMPLLSGVEFYDFNDSDVASKITPDTCGVIVEPIQGEGGIIPATKSFMRSLRSATKAVDALLICDEVQVGCGRVGRLWAHQAYDVAPDIMTLAKPLAGGLPIGVTLVTQQVADTIQAGDHGSTFGANPVICAAAVAALDELSSPQMLSHVREVGDAMFSRLLDFSIENNSVIEVRSGGGLLIGIELSRSVSPVIDRAAQLGVLIISAGPNVIRLCPPLTLSHQQANDALAIIEQAIRDTE